MSILSEEIEKKYNVEIKSELGTIVSKDFNSKIKYYFTKWDDCYVISHPNYTGSKLVISRVFEDNKDDIKMGSSYLFVNYANKTQEDVERHNKYLDIIENIEEVVVGLEYRINQRDHKALSLSELEKEINNPNSKYHFLITRNEFEFESITNNLSCYNLDNKWAIIRNIFPFFKVGNSYSYYLSKRLLDAYNKLGPFDKKYHFEFENKINGINRRIIYFASIVIYNNLVIKAKHFDLQIKLTDGQIEAMKRLCKDDESMVIIKDGIAKAYFNEGDKEKLLKRCFINIDENNEIKSIFDNYSDYIPLLDNSDYVILQYKDNKYIIKSRKQIQIEDKSDTPKSIEDKKTIDYILGLGLKKDSTFINNTTFINCDTQKVYAFRFEEDKKPKDYMNKKFKYEEDGEVKVIYNE